MGEFLSHLAADLNVAASTQNQALSALLFLYGEALKIEPARLPTVLTREETRTVLGRMSGQYRLMAELLYGSGLRSSRRPSLRFLPLGPD